MDQKIVQSVLYVVLGIVILATLELKVVWVPMLFTILLATTGFAVIIHGSFELLSTRKTRSKHFE